MCVILITFWRFAEAAILVLVVVTHYIRYACWLGLTSQKNRAKRQELQQHPNQKGHEGQSCRQGVVLVLCVALDCFPLCTIVHLGSGKPVCIHHTYTDCCAQFPRQSRLSECQQWQLICSRQNRCLPSVPQPMITLTSCVSALYRCRYKSKRISSAAYSEVNS